MALALSIKDKSAAPQSSSKQSSNQEGSSQTASSSQHKTTAQPVSSGTTAATVSRVRALYDFQPSEPGELQFRKGDIIAVLESVYKDWWKGSLRGNTGIFPLNYVEKLADPTQDELQREAQMEAEVFGQIKNVEKLLALLSTSNLESSVRDNEEITELYHSTLAIRPKLIELIGRYSQRKGIHVGGSPLCIVLIPVQDDFTQLNEKFIKARRDYESLLEASMAQLPQQYGRPPGHSQGQPPYGYPQQQGGGYPPQAATPQQGPGRYYTPGPQDQQQSTTPQPHNPPQNGPLPFTYANAPVGQRPQYPPNDPRNRNPSGSAQPPQQQQQQPPSDPYGHRPQSPYDNPQELGTSSYHNTPTVDHQPSHLQQAAYPATHHAIANQRHSQEYSPSVYTPDDVPQNSQGIPPYQKQQQQPHQQQPPYPPSAQIPSQPPPSQRQNFPPQQQQQPQASHHPPSQPPPSDPQNPYPVLNSGPPHGGYQAYQAPPAAARQEGYAAAHGAGGGGDPNGFYR